MKWYIGGRLLQLVPVLVGVSLTVFVVIRVIPGDPAVAMLGEQASPARLLELRRTFGLDRPLPLQYLGYVLDAARGDLGRSILSNRPVASELAVRFPATVELGVAAMLVGLLVGVPLGTLAATRRGSLTDAVTMTVSLFGVSMPVFWLGLVFIWIFALTLGWLPVSGRLRADLELPSVTRSYVMDAVLAGNGAAFLDALRHLVLPAITLGTIPMAGIARMTRSSLLDVLGEDYIRTARAKGLSSGRVIFKHAIRNAAIPVVALIGLQVGTLLGGAIVTETIFSWPGVGRFLLEGVLARDYPVVQGTGLVVTALFALINVVVDVCYVLLDPRVRLIESLAGNR
jgi:peptide/nickel transport system permease protein